MSKFIDMTGQRFGRLTVVERVGIAPSGHALWLCECDCGNRHTVSSNQLKSGTKSCGCLQKERATFAAKKRKCAQFHKKYDIGKDNYRLRQCYKDMVNRCYKVNNKNYKNYGYRGIKVCSEWLNDFYSFRDWALTNGYADDLTLDRINVDENYAPSNCRWVTPKAQNNNRRNNVVVTYNGETMTLHELSERYTDVGYKTLWARINAGWNLRDAIETPVRRSINGHYIKTLSARPL